MHASDIAVRTKRHNISVSLKMQIAILKLRVCTNPHEIVITLKIKLAISRGGCSIYVDAITALLCSALL